jgi:hypothetical protein
MSSKILYSTRIKNPCCPIANRQRAERNTISRKKGINLIEPENEEGPYIPTENKLSLKKNPAAS